jgi:uncharacterized protein
MRKFLATLAILISAGVQAESVESPIFLDTPSGRIVGSLIVPRNGTANTVVLIIGGSGPTDRDGNSVLVRGKNDSLKMLALALAEAGIASVRYDKRGLGASVNALGKERDLRFDTYVQDAILWLDILKKDRQFIDVSIIGHSEGALIGMIAASSQSVTSFVSISGPARSGASILRSQLKGKLPAALSQRNESIIASLESGVEVADIPNELLSLYRPSVQPYLISWFKHVPANLIKAVCKNVLIIQGDTDIQVGAEEAMSLKAACPTAQLEIISGMNHVLKIVPTELQSQIASLGDPSLFLAPQLVSKVVTFLLASEKSAK